MSIRRGARFSTCGELHAKLSPASRWPLTVALTRSQPVPRDALVAGFDDIPAASWAASDLTTFVQDGARMVDEAMAILSASAESHKPLGDVRVIVPARLVERGTTRR
jgi:DNA-binding LacI/PurR family transcriptional regulator